MISTIVSIILLLIFAFIIFSLILSFYLIFTYLLPSTSIYYFPEHQTAAAVAHEPRDVSFVEISPNMHVSVAFTPLTANINLEGTLTAPVWCTGLFHKRNAFYFPSEETIHDGNMFGFEYRDVLDVRKVDAGVDLIISVRSGNALPRTVHSDRLERHDAVMRLELRREFPDRSKLEPFRSVVYDHFVEKCVAYGVGGESKRRHYDVLLCPGTEASRLWKRELYAVFAAHHEVQVQHFDSLSSMTEYAKEINCKASDGIFCVGERFSSEDALLSGLAQNSSYSSCKVPIAYFATTHEPHIATREQSAGERIRDALYIVRRARHCARSILKSTLHCQDSVSIKYSTGRVFYGIIPQLETRRIGKGKLVRMFGHLMNTLLALKFYECPQLELTFENETKSGATNKVVKEAPFHLSMEVEDARSGDTNQSQHISLQMLPEAAHFATKLQTLFQLVFNYHPHRTYERLSKVRDMKSWRLSYDEVHMRIIIEDQKRETRAGMAMQVQTLPKDMDLMIEGSLIPKVQRLDATVHQAFCHHFERVEVSEEE